MAQILWLSVYRNGRNNLLVSAGDDQTVVCAPLVYLEATVNGCGWYGCKLTYTENRRVMRVGSLVGLTGSYNAKFSALTYGSASGDTKVYIGSGTPLEAILDYTSAGVALTGTGRVKVCAGAGWLVFHDGEPANPITGRTVAHFILNNQ